MTARIACRAAIAGLLLAGCGGGSGSAPGASTGPTTAAPAALTVTSSVFAAGAEIPTRYTCAGAGDAPPLAWTGADPTRPLALVVDDPDAPGGTFVHWVVLDLPAGTSSLRSAGALPAGAHQATNSAGAAAWAAPCPPSGTHHYRFTVYVLSAPTGLSDGVDKAEAQTAIQRLSTATGQLVGLVTSN
ncbi:MAG TPA: YbhB/YbcL family Raf kinase inhibitor-like protein [Mycobacteriales bacterium]|nr:YbhB/YbcL family Raf kinase inhibitor-like protein [Mycobacteriales bacterium]